MGTPILYREYHPHLNPPPSRGRRELDSAFFGWEERTG